MNRVEYTEKFLYLSNQWYNDGLKKSNIRDLSGAIASLRKSLQYNRDNVPARNLLGLVYYGRGEVAEALVEWIISKNIKAHGNIATYYLKKVQESVGELEAINDAIKKYNQALAYCEQGGEDLAAIQLRKVVATHPTFLRAYQLLALIYMNSEQYAKARQMIRKAHKLDTTNETTLRYMHELKQLHTEKAAQIRDVKNQSVSYKLGNETIIQPVSNGWKERTPIMTALQIAASALIGAAVVWFLITPTVRQKVMRESNREAIAYSEQISSLRNEIDLLTQQVNTQTTQGESLTTQLETANATITRYEAVLNELFEDEDMVLSLLQSYVDNGSQEEATVLYECIVKLRPESGFAQQAQEIITPKEPETTE